jgi:hypothetical protein
LYDEALANGLPAKLRAQALAWLASSLYKTGKSKGALKRIRQARAVSKDRDLRKFLDGLEARASIVKHTG